MVDELINWYSNNYRELPWRSTKDPYKIWLSEIILQQTRVAQGTPYYLKFVESYPDVRAFANADQKDILKLWQGLGYYSRARNMHACAQTVVNDHDGHFPASYHELIKLEGVGKYTGAAIASICFDERVPAVDGNVYRVLSRLFGMDADISQSKSFQIFFDKALSIMPPSGAGDFNQAVMELGAMVCTPKKADCHICPISENCYARQNQSQSFYPVKTKKIKVKKRYFQYLIVRHETMLLMKQRPVGDIWAGLYEFLLLEFDREVEHPMEVAHAVGLTEGNLLFSSATVRHQLTHQQLKIQFHIWDVSKSGFDMLKKNYKMEVVESSEIDNFAVAKPIESFLKTKELLLI